MPVSGQQVVDYLMQFKGTPYAWGGNDLKNGIDCSGLLQQGFAHFGVNINRTTYDQIGQGQGVGMKDLQIGDAVFFDTDKSTAGPDHVGIYIGGGKFLHAPKTGDVVKISDMTDNYYASRFMGGRRFNGVVGGGDANNDYATQTPVDRKLAPEEMAGKYGWSYSFMNADPSLKPLFSSAVDGNWTSDKFQAELKNTDFWKNNSDTARKALEMKSSDPATWNTTLEANKTKLAQMAAEAGAALPDGMLPQLAEHMAMLGLKDDQLKNILGNYIDFSNGTLKGQAGMHEYNMRKYAADMGVDMSQDSIKNYAQQLIKGLATPDDYRSYINDQAISSFPAFTQQIKAGQTVKNIANPYIQSMAQTLEMNPNDITVKNPMIMSGLNGLDDQGKPVGKTLVQFQDMLRGDPRWRGTQQAQDKAMNIGSTVLKNMGMIG